MRAPPGLAEFETRLLAVGRAGTAAHVERIVRGWRRVDRLAEARESQARHRRRGLSIHHDEDGMVVIRACLEPEAGALLVQALDAAREALYQKTRAGAVQVADPIADPPTPAQQRADALGLIAETALHQGLDPGAPGARYQVVVHVDAPVIADPEQPGQSVLEGGTRISAALLCRRHHRAVHEDGYQIDRAPDGTLRFRRPDGHPLVEVPVRGTVPEDPVAALRTQHEAGGLYMHSQTALPSWTGERLDMTYAIEVLYARRAGGPGRAPEP